MALFKISQGQASSLSSQPLTEGYCWFTPEDGKFYIDAKINNVLQRIPLNGNGRLFYGTSSTAAATVDKEVLCPEYNTLLPGDIVVVKFSTTNSGAVASLTLNVNGTGKKSIKKQYNNTLANLTNAGELRADTISIFVYNGTYWMLANGDWNGNDTGYYILTNGFRGQVGSNQIFKYTLFGRTSDGTYESFVTSSSTGTSKAKNPHGFLPEGKIYYNPNNSNYAAGLLGFSPYEQYHTIDYRYTFNISTTGIPASANTYLKFTYSDGLLYLADTWFATALPTTEDGFIYQRIGSNYYNSADYRGSLLLNNPYYIYKNNKIQVWHGGVSTRALTADIANTANTASTADAWTTGRTFTIGGAGKTVDGSSNVTWSLDEIGASVENTITDGTSSAAPKISTTVNGITGGSQPITIATTGKYGVTKLTDTASSSDSSLAVTGKAVNSAISTAINGLAFTEIGGSTGDYINKISQANGVITATKSVFDPSLVYTDGTSSAAPKIAPKLNGVTGGEITLTKATTSVYGVTKLTSSYDATSPNSDLAINGAGVKAAIETLDVNEVGAGSAVTSSENSNGEYIAKIKEEDGKISATVFTTSVGNTLTDGTSLAAPKITTTVNGVTGSEIILTKAATDKYGVTKLTSSYDATSPDTTLAINGAGVQAAIQTLDVAEVGASSTASDTSDGKYIAKIKEEDGKITATVFTTSVSNTITDGTTNGPTFYTTVNGVTGNTVTIPAATKAKSGVVTTTTQIFEGEKTFNKDINLTTADSDRSIIFGYTETTTTTVNNGASWRLVSLGSGSGDTNYFAIQTSGSSTGSNKTWNNVIRLSMDNKTISLFGNVIPEATTNTLSLGSSGTSGKRWKALYIGTADTYGSDTQPIYWNAGVPKAGTTYAGGTAVTLNNSSKAGSTASFYAPTAGGAQNTQALVGNGTTSEPKWVNISPSITIGAGTSSAAPTVNVTVLGQSGTAQSITTATSSAYGVTKLTDNYTSTDGTLATTGKALLAAIQTLDSTLPTGSAASKTLTALTITDGKMASATFTNISIAASQVSSGTLDLARIPTGTTSTTVALGNHTHNYAGSNSAGGPALTIQVNPSTTPTAVGSIWVTT